MTSYVIMTLFFNIENYFKGLATEYPMGFLFKNKKNDYFRRKSFFPTQPPYEAPPPDLVKILTKKLRNGSFFDTFGRNDTMRPSDVFDLAIK